MSNIVYDYIEDYIRSLISQDDPLLVELESYAALNSVPIVHKEVAKYLSLMIKLKNPEKILEVGTAIGYSAILMAKSSGRCNVTTIERDVDMVRLAEDNVKRAGLEDKIDILEGEAFDILSGLTGQYDMIFLDGAKGQYKEFFNICDKLLNPNGIIIADNVLFRGMVATNELLIRRKITIVKRMRKYLEFMSNIDGYETSVLPLGDGIAVSLKIGG